MSSSTSQKDVEITLTLGDQRAVVSSLGASLRRYFSVGAKNEWDIVWPYTGSQNKKGGQGDVLVPFPGRIKQGQYSFQGKSYTLEKNDKEGPNAIHGFLRSQTFDVVSQKDSSAIFRFEMRADDFAPRGYPFSLSVTISYELEASGLKTSYSIQNSGDSDAPVAIGFHPYFCAASGDLASWSAKIPAHKFIEFETLVPTGRVLPVEGTALDFRTNRTLGDQAYNACLAQLERDERGFAHATLSSVDGKSSVRLTLDQTFDYIVIYTGDAIAAPHARQAFAIEPMTCAPDAFNHEGWGTKTLKPGETFSGSYWVKGERA